VAGNSPTEQSLHLGGTVDEFTGDPRVRDLWEGTRRERHLVIRSMHGDPWSEATFLSRVGTVIGHGLLWLVAVPLLWAGLLLVSFFGTAVVLALCDLNQPVEVHLGTAGSGGLADVIVGGSLLLSVLCVSHAIWSKLAVRENEIRRLRGFSNSDLVKAHDCWRQQKARDVELAQQGHAAWGRRREADYLAERIGKETREAVYRAGIELEKFHDFSERIAGRR
jgi:hypothetical protein